MTNEERLAKCEAAMANLVTAMDVLTRTVSELTDKVAELDERLGKCKGMEIARQIRESEKRCENCANCSPWDGYCGLGFNEVARDRGVCERWESK